LSGFIQLAQKHRHFLFRLFVALGLRCLQAALPGATCRLWFAAGLVRLAEEFPRSRVLRVVLDAALQVFGGPAASPASR